jgi:asparaginyl-tRNA synthetase
VQFCCKAVLESCKDDLEFISERYDKTAIERLKLVATTPMQRVSYTGSFCC